MAERLAILISGGGTTMQEIIKACQTGEINMEIACVISSNQQAGGIEKAKKLKIPDKNVIIINPQDYKNESGKVDLLLFGRKIITELQDRKVTIVSQNGWLPLTPEIVIDAFEGKIFNQHPGPVPEFGGKGMYGRRVHAAVILFRRWTKGEMWTEVIAQRVGKIYDEGELLYTERVEILPTDTVDDLQQRALPIEHRLQIQLLIDIANGIVKNPVLRDPIVKLEEEEILKTAKKVAKLLFPTG
ncbi:MAG: hypothetical protein M3Q44_05980 [bacterium]|nr:hypothetical protein [bacterium]